MSSKLIQIGAARNAELAVARRAAGPEPRLSRRRFLQILGTASTAGVVAGCTDRAEQKIFPYAKAEPEQIPGIAVWYRSTCTECAAGCGTEVRVREGRAVKIEGSRAHPINQGGLCALGQAALQNTYDPDRVRQPLERVVDGQGRSEFKPIS